MYFVDAEGWGNFSHVARSRSGLPHRDTAGEGRGSLCSLARERKTFCVGSDQSVLLNSCSNPVLRSGCTMSPSGVDEPQLG